MKRTIAIVNSVFGLTGGMDRANFALARAAADAGLTVHLVAHHVDEQLAASRNIVIHKVDRPLKSDALGAPRLDSLGQQIGKQISAGGGRVVVNGANCNFADVNWLHHVHAADSAAPGGGFFFRSKQSLLRRRWLKQERAQIPRARLIIATCQRVADDAARLLTAPRDRCRVALMGVDSGQFYPRAEAKRAEARRALDLPIDRQVIGFVGAMGDRRKGFDRLFAAFVALARRNDRTVLIAVGRGADVAHWQAEAVRARLADRVIFRPFVDDVSAFFAAIDVHVLPSRYEGFSLVTAESLACDTPALVGRNSGIADLYPTELADWIIDDAATVDMLADQFDRMLREPDAQRRRLTDFSRRLRERSWDDMAAEMLRLMESPARMVEGRGRHD